MNYTRLGGSRLTGGMQGLHEKQCQECGKTFVCNKNWAYKGSVNSRVAYYCSYKCMRVREREREGQRRQKEYEREAREQARAERIKQEAQKNKKEDRVKVCLGKIEHWSMIQSQRTPGTQEYNQARENVSVWTRKLKAALSAQNCKSARPQ